MRVNCSYSSRYRHAIIAQNGPRHELLAVANHQTLWHNRERTHMDVQGKRLYTFRRKKGCCEGDDRGIRCA